MEEQESRIKEKGIYKGFLFGIAAGSLIGATAALLYAPKKGKELRKDISKKKDKMVKDAEHYVKDAKKRASNIINQGKKKANLLLEEAKKKMESIKNRSVNLIDEGKDKLSRESNLFKDAFKAGNDAYKEERKTIH